MPDGLRELFQSQSVCIDTQDIVCAFVSEPGTCSTEQVTQWYLQYSQTIISRRGCIGGKSAVACSGSFARGRFRHAEGVDENFRRDFLYKYLILNNHVVKESAIFSACFSVSCRILSHPMCTCVT